MNIKEGPWSYVDDDRLLAAARQVLVEWDEAQSARYDEEKYSEFAYSGVIETLRSIVAQITNENGNGNA